LERTYQILVLVEALTPSERIASFLFQFVVDFALASHDQDVAFLVLLYQRLILWLLMRDQLH
jgi:hypothetical protein